MPGSGVTVLGSSSGALGMGVRHVCGGGVPLSGVSCLCVSYSSLVIARFGSFCLVSAIMVERVGASGVALWAGRALLVIRLR